MKYTIEKEDKPRFSWWRDVAAVVFMAAMAWALVVFAVEALSYERYGDCTVCLWEMVK